MGWDGPILTDSGGFQVFSLAHLGTVDEDGVTFASHLDGSPHRLTPEVAMEIQEALGSDIAMAFDQLIDPDRPRQRGGARRWRGPTAGRSAAWRRTRGRTRRCSASCRAAWTTSSGARACAPWPALPFDGIAIGGLSVGETKEEMAATLDVVADALGDDPRVRYLMGVGSPADFFTAIERGMDLFDCVLPTRVARNGQLWTSEGKLNLRNARFQDDPVAGGRRLRLRDLPEPLARLPGAPVPGRGAARVSPRLAP